MLPEELVKWYVTNGYHFLGVSEHNLLADHESWLALSDIERRTGSGTRCSQAAGGQPSTRGVDGADRWRLMPFSELRGRFESRGRFLLLQNEEITNDFQTKRLHLTAVNIQSVIAPSSGGEEEMSSALQQNLQRLEAARLQSNEPVVGVINHPNFTWAIGPAELASAQLARFVEVFNGHPFAASRGDVGKRSVVRMWDVANAERVLQRGWHPLYGVAADDTHALEGAAEASPGRGWIMVRAARLRPRELITAMLAGDFYASTGVTLSACDYDLRTHRLSIAVAAVPSVSYQIDFIATKVGAHPFETNSPADRWDVPEVGMLARRVIGTRADYTLALDDAYVRATVTATRKPANPMRSNYTGDEAQFEQAFTQPVGWNRKP